MGRRYLAPRGEGFIIVLPSLNMADDPIYMPKQPFASFTDLLDSLQDLHRKVDRQNHKIDKQNRKIDVVAQRVDP